MASEKSVPEMPSSFSKPSSRATLRDWRVKKLRKTRSQTTGWWVLLPCVFGRVVSY